MVSDELISEISSKSNLPQLAHEIGLIREQLSYLRERDHTKHPRRLVRVGGDDALEWQDGRWAGRDRTYGLPGAGERRVFST
jgi:hypothetical protein